MTRTNEPKSSHPKFVYVVSPLAAGVPVRENLLTPEGRGAAQCYAQRLLSHAGGRFRANQEGELSCAHYCPTCKEQP